MNKYAVKYSRAYKTSRKKLNKNDKELLESVVSKLARGETLEARFKDHALSGDYEGFRDCHVRVSECGKRKTENGICQNSLFCEFKETFLLCKKRFACFTGTSFDDSTRLKGGGFFGRLTPPSE